MRIVKIGALWCPGCLVMKKIWNKINEIYDLDIVDLDYDMDNDEVKKYYVGDILPVIIFFDKDGNELERLIGEQKENKLISLIEKYREI